MLGIVSSCATVTLSLRGAVFTVFDFKKFRDLEIGVRGHSRSLTVAPFERLCMISYYCSLVTLFPTRLRNDLYCVEWDVKPYYTIPYHTIVPKTHGF